MPPLVSILTPSFNQGRWLGDNLASVAAQSYGSIEHVVMDGGSRDETLDLLEATDGRVKWRSEPDRGQSHALNKALGASEGEYIGWLNSDDAYFSRDAVSDVVSVFDADPSVNVVYGPGNWPATSAASNGTRLIWHRLPIAQRKSSLVIASTASSRGCARLFLNTHHPWRVCP